MKRSKETKQEKKKKEHLVGVAQTWESLSLADPTHTHMEKRRADLHTQKGENRTFAPIFPR